MMRNKITLCIILIAGIYILGGCQCKHEWTEADCDSPKTCTLCEETEGAPLGHVWLAATCTTPRTCEVCSETQGEASGHSWKEATCLDPRICTVCEETDGSELGHDWAEATTDLPKTCRLCELTDGYRIITDARFTTEACKDFIGTWIYETTLSHEKVDRGYFETTCDVLATLSLYNDGTFSFRLEPKDMEEYRLYVIDMSIAADRQLFWATEEYADYTDEDIEALYVNLFNMSRYEYFEKEVTQEFLENSIASGYTEGVYYIQDGSFYCGDSWENTMTPYSYKLENGTLSIDRFLVFKEDEAVWTKEVNP